MIPVSATIATGGCGFERRMTGTERDRGAGGRDPVVGGCRGDRDEREVEIVRDDLRGIDHPPAPDTDQEIRTFCRLLALLDDRRGDLLGKERLSPCIRPERISFTVLPARFMVPLPETRSADGPSLRSSHTAGSCPSTSWPITTSRGSCIHLDLSKTRGLSNFIASALILIMDD